MNLVAPIWNCPTVAYGPGDSDLDHTPNEHILVSEYQHGVQILVDVLRTV
jgi:LysW-gamma-L-lysine carboxypeptidase